CCALSKLRRSCSRSRFCSLPAWRRIRKRQSPESTRTQTSKAGMNQNAKVCSERGPVIQKDILDTDCRHAKLTTSGFRPPSERKLMDQVVFQIARCLRIFHWADASLPGKNVAPVTTARESRQLCVGRSSRPACFHFPFLTKAGNFSACILRPTSY